MLKEQKYCKPIWSGIRAFGELKTRILRSVRGECPYCHSADLQEVKNWNMMICKKCGRTFRYD